MDRHRSRGARVRRGFSIVELVVAMMLVAVGVLSLVGANADATISVERIGLPGR